MDAVEFHREPPSSLATMVMAFGGWIDAGEAATDALRFLVRQLAAEPLAAIDLEDFVDFTQVRPVVRLTATGERTIRWPRNAFWIWQPPAGGAGLLIGSAVLLPGALSRREALARRGRRALKLVTASTLFLLLAGSIEGNISPLPWPTEWKLFVALVTGLMIVFYVTRGRDRALGSV